MRLTLRTLLSWKDGMLEAEAGRDLAGKVEASDAARRLVERIEEVVARPTLSAAAPDATGFTASANTTAEYLDNALPAERLGEFERACFASDVQLAETAATHEILAALSREPAAALDAATRRRLLAAVRARADAERGTNADAALPSPARGRRPAPDAGRTPPRPAGAPATAWLLVAAALALLVVLVGVLGWSLAKRGAKPAGASDVAARRDEVREPAAAGPATAAPAEEVPVPAAPVAATPAAAEVPVPAGTPVPEPAAPPSPAPAAPGGARGTASGTPAPVAGPTAQPPAADGDAEDLPPFGDAEPMAPVAAVPDASGNPFAAAEPPPATAPAGGSDDRRVPQGDALAIAAPAPPGPAAVPADASPPAVAAPHGTPVAVVGPAVLLHRPAGGTAADWLAGVDGSPLELPVDLVAPPFNRPSLAVAGTRITLEPGTRAVLGRDADGTPRLEVVFGAAVAAGGERLGVTCGGLAGVVAAGLATPVGVEARITRPPGGAAESAERIARILPTAGPVDWRPTAIDGGGSTEPAGAAAIPPGQALVWRSARPEAAAVEADGPPPDWLAGRRIDDGIGDQAAQALAARLAAGTAALPALRELAADRGSARRLAAAAALALVGEFDAVARLMCAAGPDKLPDAQWERLDAVAVQPALARGPKAAEALAAAFAAQAPPGAAEPALRLARGFSDEDLAAGGAAELVAALENPHLVVRRYAIANLVEIARPTAVERSKYRADRPADGLREGAAWWRVRLDQGRIRRGP